MQPEDVLRAVCDDSDLSMVQISKAIGRSNMFIGSYVSKKLKPNIGLMAEIADATNHDFLLRNRVTGDEIYIDPPE